MAKKKIEPVLTSEEKAKLRRPVGVYLRKSTRIEVDKIVEAEDMSRHALLAYAVADFVRRYKAGEVKIETTTKTTINLDV